MGSDQSTQKKAPAATPRDVERALEKQRVMYEKKIEKMIQEKLNVQSSTTGPDSNQQNPNVEMERQRNAFNQNNQNMQHGPTLYPSLNVPPAVGYHIPTQPKVMQNPNLWTHNNYGQPQNSNFYGNLQPAATGYPAPSAPSAPSAPPNAPPGENASKNSSRSQSRSRNNEHLNCGTCGLPFREKIFRCISGHSCCNMCKLRQAMCGVCKQSITKVRNIDLEKIAMERKLPCSYTADGCRLHIKVGDLTTHEKECPFKVLPCPSLGAGCAWSGKLNQLAEHFNEMHPLHNQGGVDKEMLLSNIAENNHIMHYIALGNFNFLFHVKTSKLEKKIYMLVQLIGTKQSAAKWFYEIHMYKKNEPRRKFQYIDACISNSESVEEIMKKSSCAIIPQEYAQTFLSNGCVTYKCYIKRDDSKAKKNFMESVDGNKQTVDGRGKRNFKQKANNSKARGTNNNPQ